MLVREFLEEVKNRYSKYFNESACHAELRKGLGESICISCYLAKDKEELINGYYENDMMNVRFWIHSMPKGITLDDEMPDNVILENQAKSFNIKPDNTYMCYGSKSVSFRKSTGTDTKTLDVLDRFFKKLNDEIKKAKKDNISHEKFNDLIVKRVK